MRTDAMSKSEEIRSLAASGMGTADIARKLGVRYQHVYNVLTYSGVLTGGGAGRAKTGNGQVSGSKVTKPVLAVEELIRAGFQRAATWVLSGDGELALEGRVPEAVGVYAFANNGVVQYVGVATMGLAKRLYFYRKPGATQRTSRRLNAILKEQLVKAPFIEIYVAMPPNLAWNGLPVHGSAGLELGLITTFALPWNMRSAG